MLPKMWRLNSFILMMFSSLSAFADTPATGAPTSNSVTSISAVDMLRNFATDVPSLMRLATALAYVVGMYFILIGIVKLKHAGESRTMTSQEHAMTEPMMYLIAGALLLYLPTSVQVGLSTFWSTPNPYGYLDNQNATGPWGDFYSICFSVVQFFGVVAFIRGVIMLSHLGGRGGHQGGIGKAMTHIIGGLFCINIYEFVKMVLATLGIDTTFF